MNIICNKKSSQKFIRIQYTFHDSILNVNIVTRVFVRWIAVSNERKNCEFWSYCFLKEKNDLIAFPLKYAICNNCLNQYVTKSVQMPKTLNEKQGQYNLEKTGLARPQIFAWNVRNARISVYKKHLYKKQLVQFLKNKKQ